MNAPLPSRFPLDRRAFLHTAAVATAALSLPRWSPLAVGGEPARPTPSQQVTLGLIGTGWMGRRSLDSFLAIPEARILAVCDVDKRHAEEAKDRINGHYANRDCRVYYDFREMLARPALDAISLAVPDHWHAVIATHAAKAGLDVHAEGPLAHTVREGQAIIETTDRYQRIWQGGEGTGFGLGFQRAIRQVRSRQIGRVQTIEIGLPSAPQDLAGTAGQENPGRPPVQLDYEFWLGPAPWGPYCPARVHRNWRWNLDYGGGFLTELGGAWLELAFAGLDLDPLEPLEIEGSGEPPTPGLWNVPTRFRLHVAYPDGLEVRIASGDSEVRPGIRWIGDQGWVRVDQDGLEAEPALSKMVPPPKDAPPDRAPTDPHPAFLEAVRRRTPTRRSARTAQRLSLPGRLGLLALSLGRKIRWNREKQEVIGDPTANRALGPALREPWTLA